MGLPAARQLLPKFMRPRERFNRAYRRHDCEIDTTLMLIDRMYSYEGRLIDISCGGGMFRPKLAYIMYRADTPVCMQLGSEELFGHVVTTSPKGFSIRFDEPLDQEDVDDFLVQFDKLSKKKPVAA